MTTERKITDARASELARLIEATRVSVGPLGHDDDILDDLAGWMLSHGENLLADRAADLAEIDRRRTVMQEAAAVLNAAGITPAGPNYLAADIRRLACERDEARELLRECRSFIEAAPKLDYGEDRTLSWITVTCARVDAALAAPPAPDADPAVLARHAAVQAGDLSGAVDLPDKRDADDLLPQITAVVRDADRAFERAGGSTRHWVRDCFLPLLARAGLTITAVRSEAPDPREAAVEAARKLAVTVGWQGDGPNVGHYYCEHCDEAATNASQIPHTDGCRAKRLLDALAALDGRQGGSNG